MYVCLFIYLLLLYLFFSEIVTANHVLNKPVHVLDIYKVKKTLSIVPEPIATQFTANVKQTFAAIWHY